MSRVFTVQNLLLQTSNALLQELLDRLGHGRLDIPWTNLDEHDTGPIDTALLSLPPTQFDDLEGLFRTLFDLACGSGIAAIREAATCLDREAGLTDMPMDRGLYDPVVWAWLRDSEVVEFASLIHKVESLSWWRRRDDLPRREPDRSPESLLRLGQAVSVLLQERQGRGRKCTVEPLVRTRTRYYFAYPDDYVQNVTAHDDHGLLRSRTFRRTFSIVFAFDPAAGALELYAGRMSYAIKQELEVLFARVVLGVEVPRLSKPTYGLEEFKWRGVTLPTDPADRIEVSISEIRLQLRATQQEITLKANPDRGPNDVYDMIDRYLNLEQVPLSGTRVTLIGFHVVFLDARGPGRTLDFHVATPNTCSLRNQRQERLDLMMKYLARWGVYARETDPDLAAAG